MRDTDLDRIRNLALFRDIAAESFDRLMLASYLQRFPPHVQLITQGDAPDFLYVVVEGMVEMFAAHRGRETSMILIRPVAAFIPAAVLTDTPWLMSARTLEPSQLLLIPAQNIREVLLQDAGFARAIAQETSRAYRGMVKSLKEHKLRFGTERLAALLLRLSVEQGDAAEITLPVGKRTVAGLLGMTPETLSRSFAALAAQGVEVSGRTIRIGDRQALAALACPEPHIDDPTY